MRTCLECDRSRPSDERRGERRRITMAERSEIDHAREVLPGRKRRCFGSARDVLTGSDRGFLGCATREVGQQGKHVQLSGRCAGACVLVPFYCDARTTRSHMAGAGEGRALRQSAGLHHTHRSHRGKVGHPKPTCRRSWHIKFIVAPVFKGRATQNQGR